MDNISNSSEFRLHILNMLIESDWLLRYGAIIQPEFFPSKDEQNFVRWLNEFYTTYHDVPFWPTVHDAIGDNPIISKIQVVSKANMEYAATRALEFAKQQAMKLAVLESVESINDGNLDQVLSNVKNALKIGVDKRELGVELVADIDDWLYDEVYGKRYPTGWRKIDAALGGGIVPGEYGLVMAPTGKGKTTALVNIGFAMAGLLSAANVLHISYEMPASKVLRRYGARLTGQYAPRGDGLPQYAEELKAAAWRKLRARLRVVNPKTDLTLTGIRSLLDNLHSAGFDAQTLIVDYPDLMEPPRKRKARRFELEDITRGLRAIGAKYEIPVWGATQAGRQAFYKEVITTADISEAIGKATIADVILAICQTRDEEKLGHGRLFCAKMRDAPDGMMIPVKLDFSRALISQRGTV